MKGLNTGDKVKYISDVYPDYTGQTCTVFDFDLKHRLVGLKFDDGQVIAAFWDEIEH